MQLLLRDVKVRRFTFTKYLLRSPLRPTWSPSWSMVDALITSGWCSWWICWVFDFFFLNFVDISIHLCSVQLVFACYYVINYLPNIVTRWEFYETQNTSETSFIVFHMVVPLDTGFGFLFWCFGSEYFLCTSVISFLIRF